MPPRPTKQAKHLCSGNWWNSLLLARWQTPWAKTICPSSKIGAFLLLYIAGSLTGHSSLDGGRQGWIECLWLPQDGLRCKVHRGKSFTLIKKDFLSPPVKYSGWKILFFWWGTSKRLAVSAKRYDTKTWQNFSWFVWNYYEFTYRYSTPRWIRPNLLVHKIGCHERVRRGDF